MEKAEEQRLQANSEAAELSQTPPGKRKYLKPAYDSEPIFETNAIGCSKIGGQGGSCNVTPSFS